MLVKVENNTNYLRGNERELFPTKNFSVGEVNVFQMNLKKI
jgi:hypothetical protein